ncbi:chemotaxis protein CheW [Clostridium cylindrosporum]|uniref:Chemotaxis protein CheW n=1 Tax=Clostridium cylindrosporum DSM 605 TaxID=1121307 RepID=A0A0J8D6G0_CLOCY|nr:chemotaxis protein CheW [Clostridium cylindrosporum]KMT21675.1 chemotaxis protein CheW [Clostridium cylindrosporum DSM 605]
MKSCKVVIFKINNEEYAADIMEVERILGYSEPTKIPDSPDYIKGIIDYHDTILPIIDIKERFNLKNTGYNEESKIIVVKSGNTCVGLSVDAVLEVIDIFENKIESAPEIAKRDSNKYIKSIININNRIIVFLDTHAIVQSEELVSLSQ